MSDMNKCFFSGVIKKSPPKMVTKAGNPMTVLNLEIQNEKSRTWTDLWAFELAEQLIGLPAETRIKVEATMGSRKKNGHWELIFTILDFMLIDAEVEAVEEVEAVA